MSYMLYVRSSHALRTTQPPARISPRIVCPPLDSRQGASAFNQPLGFDTSSVTDMSYMFLVRSTHGLPPSAVSRASPVHSPYTLLAPLSHAALPSAGPHLAPRIVCPHFGSAGRKGVPPAAGFRHVQRHHHIEHVWGTLTQYGMHIS